MTPNYRIIFWDDEIEAIHRIDPLTGKKIESEKFFKEEVQPGGKMTISIGTATFPDDAKNYSKLVEKADKALYQAKNAGRNQLRIYEDNKNGE